MVNRLPSARTLALAFALLFLAFGIGGFLVAWSGVYNVAASRDHWWITQKILEFGLRNSIETHSLGITAPRLDDPDLIRLGAGHFADGCAVCHGAPGKPRSPVARRMLPTPPPLSEAVGHWSDAELFWIVKNGLKYTGMPAWLTPRRDDEVWAVVAYLRELPKLDAEANRALADLRAESRTVPGVPPSCIGCHGDGDQPPISRLIPKLDGLSAAYIEFSLRSYRAGTRPSGVMQQFAESLDDATIAHIAAYYSGLARRPGGAPGANDSIARGRVIAERGLPAEGIPPCLACHEGRTREIFPRLAGQHARYIVGQLELFQRGVRQETAPGQIMTPIARRLSPEQIRDVAAFLAALPPGSRP